MNPTSNDKFQFLLGRRSIRVYAPGEVGEAVITQPTTAQSLGALLKSARDIMRKDKGRDGKAEG